MRTGLLTFLATASLALAACSRGVEAGAPEPAAPTVRVEPAIAPVLAVAEAAEADRVTPSLRVPRRRQTDEADAITLEQMQARALRGFERIDADSDGQVTETELQRAAEAGQPGARAWGRADGDGDGRLTPEEVRSVISRRFRLLDADADGIVTPVERNARPWEDV